MSVALAASRLRAVVGTSHRLRDAVLARLTTDWSGLVRGETDAGAIEDIIVGLETPSLFGDQEMVILRIDEKAVTRHADRLVPLAGAEVVAGVLVLVVDKLLASSRLAKALKTADALEAVPTPSRKDLLPWLVDILRGLDRQVDHPGEVSKALIKHYGEDPDAVLGGLDVTLNHAREDLLTVADVLAVSGGDAGRPIWEFTEAVLKGDLPRAFHLLSSDRELTPERALTGIATEVRKRLACLESRDDGEVWKMLGGRRGGSLYYTRRETTPQDRGMLERLLRGVTHAQVDCRRGVDRDMILEQFLVNVDRVIRSDWRRGGGRSGR